MNKNLFLIIAIGSFIFYLKKSKQEAGSLRGKIGPYKINPETVVDSALPWLNLSPFTHNLVKMGATQFLKGLVGEDYSDNKSIDADYRRIK